MYGRANADLYPRQSTKMTDWTAAEAYRISVTRKSKSEAVHGPKIEDCIERFQAARKHEIGHAAALAYKRILGILLKYCEKRGIHFMNELSVDLVEDFKVDGITGIAETTKGGAVMKLRCFLREAFRRGWITTHLAERVRPHQFEHEEKMPFSDKEVAAILGEAGTVAGTVQGFISSPGTLKVLIEVLLETGMRVSDAIRLDPAAIKKGESLWVYTYSQKKRKRTKRPEHTEVYLSDHLKKAIDSCHWLSPNRPFWFGSATDQYRVYGQVYHMMQDIGHRCGVDDCRPHRFRDTFAARALLRGISIGDVSRLLGHSSVRITEMYYAKWIPARGRRLESVVAQSLVNV